MSIYGLWTVIDEAPRGEFHKPHWLCRCRCGTERPVRVSSLVTGASRSCGCVPPRRKKTTVGTRQIIVTLALPDYEKLLTIAGRKSITKNKLVRSIIVKWLQEV